jgi:hypothetical protein
VTHSQRADELLVEARSIVGWAVAPLMQYPDESSSGARALCARIDAHLAEPQGEPQEPAEYVWRVLTEVPGIGIATRIANSEESARRVHAVLSNDSRSLIERAQIGPWERVS